MYCRYYIMHHLNFLMYFLIDEIEEMGQFYNHFNILNTISRDVFKSVLREDLKSLIKNHSKIIRYTLRLKNIQLMFYFVSIPHLIIGLFCILAFTLPQIPKIYTGLYTIIYVMLVLPYILCGQSNINTSEEISRALYDLPWYNWDVDNMKLLRTFLILADRKVEMRFQNFWAINCQFWKEHLKTIYSLSSLFNSMK
ncbi:uncharacterized protein LOC143202013 [Rhynchophorus ferrugineus]|uniref:uncharacterized protein LOC143202013 n=1 Tax=Rhynchophorus ferrugineus TaxID=354439 RepID=UPI003FCC496D